MTNARRVGGVVVMAIGLVAGGCLATPPPSASPGSPTASAPAMTAVATPAASASETIGSPPPPTPAPLSNAPLAILVIGAQRHPGEVGGFTFGRFSESAPWLPATALDTVQVPAGTELRVELDERAMIEDWAARIATAADVTADAVTGLASGVGPAATFDAPGPGDWVVSVTITYGQGLGSGAYYWRLIVE